jgi:hypothetical protein
MKQSNLRERLLLSLTESVQEAIGKYMEGGYYDDSCITLNRMRGFFAYWNGEKAYKYAMGVNDKVVFRKAWMLAQDWRLEEARLCAEEMIDKLLGKA